MPDLIKTGDEVDVWINGNVVLAQVKVVYIPSATGDCWILEDTRLGDLWYITELCSVRKRIH